MPINDKNKYRKKSYTHPEHEIKPDGFSAYWIDRLLELSEPDHPQKNLFSKLIEIGKKGADLRIIFKNIDFFEEPEKKHEKLKLLPNAGEYNQRIKKLANKKKAVKGAVSQIKKLEPLGTLEPLESIDNDGPSNDFRIWWKQRKEWIDNINGELEHIQYFLPIIIEKYFSELESGVYLSGLFSSEPLKNVKNRKEASQRLNKKIVIIVNELTRIGYSNKKAYKITGTLLHLSYPTYFSDPDPDIVRQRYKYHFNKQME